MTPDPRSACWGAAAATVSLSVAGLAELLRTYICPGGWRPAPRGKYAKKDRDLRCQTAAELRGDLKRLKRDQQSSSHHASVTRESGATATATPSSDTVQRFTRELKLLRRGNARLHRCWRPQGCSRYFSRWWLHTL